MIRIVDRGDVVHVWIKKVVKPVRRLEVHSLVDEALGKDRNRVQKVFTDAAEKFK